MFLNKKNLKLILLAMLVCNTSFAARVINDDGQSNIKNQVVKIYEKNLTEEELSAEGVSLELYKKEGYCEMSVVFYGETGKSSYEYHFNKNRLKKTIYKEFKFSEGIININPSNHYKLIKVEEITGSSDKEISSNFKYFLNEIPVSILEKNCHSFRK